MEPADSLMAAITTGDADTRSGDPFHVPAAARRGARRGARA